jgi:hypothetical protein
MRVINVPTYGVGLSFTWSKSPLPKWDMIREFMRKKSNFSTQGRATLFTHTNTPISFDQALKFFELNSTLNPFLLVANPLPS